MKQRHARLACRIGGRAAIFFILTTLFTAAYARPRNNNNIVIESYSQMYHVAAPEAAHRLKLIREAGLLGQRLERELPKTFAGLYIEHRPEFRIVVQFTQDAQAQLAAYTRDRAFVARTAPRSLEPA